MLKNIILAIIFVFALFMAWSAFQWMGVIYVLLVPIPLFLFSKLVQKKKQEGAYSQQKEISLWTSPIPYLSLFFVVIILFNIIG